MRALESSDSSVTQPTLASAYSERTHAQRAQPARSNSFCTCFIPSTNSKPNEIAANTIAFDWNETKRLMFGARPSSHGLCDSDSIAIASSALAPRLIEPDCDM